MGWVTVLLDRFRSSQSQQFAGGLDDCIVNLQFKFRIQHCPHHIGAIGILLRHRTDIGPQITIDFLFCSFTDIFARALNHCRSPHFALWRKVNLLRCRCDERTRRNRIIIYIRSSDTFKAIQHLHHFECNIQSSARCIHVKDNHIDIVRNCFF